MAISARARDSGLSSLNLEEIRRAVVTRIVADHDYFKGKEQKEEESL